MSNFTIQISDEFLSRFPEEERALAAARARHVLFGIEVGYNWRHLSTIMQMSEAELSQPYRYKDDVPESENFVSCVPYFDEHAVIVINRGDSKESRLTAMNVIGGVTMLWREFYSDLRDVITNHTNIEYSGTYNSPFGSAMTSRNFELLTMLSYNPNFNPNVTMRKKGADRGLEVKREDHMEVVNDDLGMEPISVIEEFSKNYNLDKEFFLRYPKTDTMIRYFDRGAIVNADAIHNMQNDPQFERMLKYIAACEQRLDTVTGTDYTAQDVMHAHALGRLRPMIQRMNRDPEARERLLELREELPGWMNKILAPVYALLDQTWVEATSQSPTNFTERS